MSPTYDYTNKQASFHSRQTVESEDSARSFCWCASIRTGMARENNSTSVRTAELSSVNNAVRFAWFHKFSELPPEANTWAHSRCRSTAWSRGAVWRKFSWFRADSTQYPSMTYNFHRKSCHHIERCRFSKPCPFAHEPSIALVLSIQKSQWPIKNFIAHAQK